jgi:hypothetical protein
MTIPMAHGYLNIGAPSQPSRFIPRPRGHLLPHVPLGLVAVSMCLPLDAGEAARAPRLPWLSLVVPITPLRMAVVGGESRKGGAAVAWAEGPGREAAARAERARPPQHSLVPRA